MAEKETANKSESGGAADKNEERGGAKDKKEPKGDTGLVTYHVLRRHDGEGDNQYDTADAIDRGGAGAAHRQSKREMRPDDAKALIEMGVLGDKAPPPRANAPATMVGLGRKR